MVSTEQWGTPGSISGKCLEFLSISFRHFPSLDHSSAASCRKRRQRERYFRQLFHKEKKSYLRRFQFEREVGHPEEVNIGRPASNRQGVNCVSNEERALPLTALRFYGHVLTALKSREECLLKSWRLNRKSLLSQVPVAWCVLNEGRA